MSHDWLSIVLVGILVLQEIHHYIVTQKLINKIMAGNYQAYLAAQTIGKPREVKERPDDSAQEDLGILSAVVR